MTAVRDNGTREAHEWRAGEQRNAVVRLRVAGQLSELLATTDIGGGRSVIARRVRAYIAAEEAGDVMAVRAACMELATAAAATAASLDLATGPSA